MVRPTKIPTMPITTMLKMLANRTSVWDFAFLLAAAVRSPIESMGRQMDRRKSLRQLAKELGVSPSYLSQIKHGRRPASPKVLSKVLSISANERLSEPFFPAIIQAAFEHKALPSGVVAAQGNLDPLVQVQFLARQPLSSTP